MARFRNRIVKAEFWTDGELRRWPLAKRVCYQALWAIAEDSGCLEDDPFEWIAQIFSSPLDRDITLEQCEAWRDELVAAGKLIPYETEGKRFLFIRTFHEHEHPRNPQPPGLPLPAWVEWTQTITKKRDGRDHKVNAYVVNADLAPGRTGEPGRPVPKSPRAGGKSVPTSGGAGKGSPVRSGPVRSSPALTPEHDESAATDQRAPSSGEDVSHDIGAEEQSPEGSLENLRQAPTCCDGHGCEVRLLKVGIRSEVAEIVGAENAGQLYNPLTSVNKALAGMAGYMCAACWRASADPGVTMDDRQPLCERALRSFVASIAAFHRSPDGPIRSLPAFLRTRYANMTEAPVPDEILAGLRLLERGDRTSDSVELDAGCTAPPAHFDKKALISRLPDPVSGDAA